MTNLRGSADAMEPPRFNRVKEIANLTGIEDRGPVEFARALRAQFGVQFRIVEKRETQLGTLPADHRVDDRTVGRDAA